MGRAAKGTVLFEGGRWKARITMADKTRRTVALPPGISEDRAREIALEMSQESRLLPSTAAPSEVGALETVEEYGTRFVNWKIKKGHVTALDTRGRLRKWVFPVIGQMPIGMVRRGELEAVVRNLDAAASTGRISTKTAGNAWRDVTGMFAQACQSKDEAMKIREDDPSEKVAGPDSGIDKEKPILFADELTRLLACDKIPVVRRRAYAFAVYLGARANEIAALTAADFDMAHGTVTISKQRDRKTDADKRTKTKRTRVTSIELALVPLVEAMAESRPRGRLFDLDDADMPNDEQRASQLRADLKRAGVLRRELHTEGDAQRLPMWFHHLRDTGLCWMAIRGDDPLRIQWRGGHTDFKTTQRYIAQGRMLADGGAFRANPPFPALPAAIIPARIPARLASDDPGSEGQTEASPTGFEAVLQSPIAPDHGRSAPVDFRNGGLKRAIGVRSGAPSRRLRAGELHPRDAARFARDGSIALGLRRCQALAEEQDERGTLAAIHDVAELLWGRS